MTSSHKRRRSLRHNLKYSGLGIASKIVPQRFRSRLDPVRRQIRNALDKFDKSAEEQKRLDRMIGPAGHWDEIQEYQFNLLKTMGLEPHHKLLDIGCGPLPGGLAFIPYLDAGNYFGIDLHEDAMNEAHVQVAKAGLAVKNPHLLVSSTFGSQELDGYKFDYIWASQMTYHLDSSLLESCLEQVASCLKPDGKFYADFISNPDQVRPDKRWLDYSFHFHKLEDVVELSKSKGLAMSNLGKIEDYGYPVAWRLKNNYLLEFRLA